MLQIEIDGKEVSVEQGSTIIEAAKSAGTYIPHFCYHKKLSIAANCRMCLVEVEKAPKPLPACATPVTDGMKVCTHSAKAKEAQQGVLEFLLINHPLDCPVCDQGGECQLQDLSMGYGQGSSRFHEEKHVVPAKDMGPLVSAQEMSRCIHCTRCIRFTEEIAGYQEIGMINRGEHSEIIPYINKTVESEISGNVIDLCPVGALTSKPFRYSARSWELSRRKSISAHDALGSNLVVQVKDRQVKRVLPLENEEINECWLSDRDRFAYEGLNHHDRLLHPKIKQDGQWHDVDWQTAFNYIAKGLNGVARDHGKDAIGMWINPANTVEELYLAKKLADTFNIKSIDAQLFQQDNRLEIAKKGSLWLGQSIESLVKSDAIFVIGSNLRIEQPLLTTRLRKAANNGSQISTLHYKQEQLYMPVSVSLVKHPADWLTQLKELIFACQNTSSCEHIQAIASSLKAAEQPSIILGADAQNHPQFADLYMAATKLAKEVGATLGILPQAANSVAIDVLNIKAVSPQFNFENMLAKPRKAVILLNVEADKDTAKAQHALNTLKEAETVIAFSAFNSPVYEEYADIILPIAPYTETSGSFINMEGRLQSFHGVTQNLGESRPLWKILRVLANVLDLEGFEFNSSQEVLAEALPSQDIRSLLNNDVQLSTTFEEKVISSKLLRVGGTALYQSDAVLRRATALQQTIHAQVPPLKVNAKTLQKLALHENTCVFVKQGKIELTLMLIIDNSLADDVVFLPLHQENSLLGSMMEVIEMRRG